MAKAKPAKELAARCKKVLQKPRIRLSGDASQSAYRKELDSVQRISVYRVMFRLTQKPRRLEAAPMSESPTQSFPTSTF